MVEEENKALFKLDKKQQGVVNPKHHFSL